MMFFDSFFVWFILEMLPFFQIFLNQVSFAGVLLVIRNILKWSLKTYIEHSTQMYFNGTDSIKKN